MDLVQLVQVALAEDMIQGVDHTSEVFLPESAKAEARIEARNQCVVSGLDVAASVFRAVDSTLNVELMETDGTLVEDMAVVMKLSGCAKSILRAERTALNFLGHLSGIATHTRRFVDAVVETSTRILATRKTTPGMRELEIAAVRHGGGDVYRTNLTEGVLLKDNHIALLGGMKAVAERVAFLKREHAELAESILTNGKVEVSNLEELQTAVETGWKQILLDNFEPEQVEAAVERYGTQAVLEVSGGVTLENVGRYAQTGVPYISIGALTHSSKAMDFSLEIERRLP